MEGMSDACIILYRKVGREVYNTKRRAYLLFMMLNLTFI
jgi:hypothetical protein